MSVAATYAELTEAFPLRPIRTTQDRAAAQKILRALMRVDQNLDQADYFAVACLLIREYDAEHVALPTLTQGDVLRSLLEDRGITQAKLAAATGVPDSNISAILANHRGISRANRAKFGQFFGVSPLRFVVA